MRLLVWERLLYALVAIGGVGLVVLAWVEPGFQPLESGMGGFVAGFFGIRAALGER